MRKIVVLYCVFLTGNCMSQNPNWLLFDHTNAPFVNDSITWVDVDAYNVKWIGTRNGLYSFNNNTWKVYNTSNSNIPNNRIDKFKIAHDNTIWFLNHSNGFIKFKNNVFTLFNQNNLPLLSSDSLVGLTIDSNEVFFWTDKKGIIKFNSLNNSVDTINLSNSCLKEIECLVNHGNHMIYGLTKNAMPAMMQPQTFSDSIQSANDFKINNTLGVSINYCFLDFFNNCNYIQVMTDRFGNRYEIASALPSSSLAAQSIRTYDINNVLVSNVNYIQNPDKQIATNGHGVYRLNSSGIDQFNGTIFGTSTHFTYHALNSIIPSASIINFEIDTLNNAWLATPSGLVAYNDLGVITKVDNVSVSDFDIYPSPITDILHVKSSYDIETITLLSITGQVLLQENINDKTHQLQLQNLAEGIYFVRVVYANGMSTVKKVIKQ